MKEGIRLICRTTVNKIIVKDDKVVGVGYTGDGIVDNNKKKSAKSKVAGAVKKAGPRGKVAAKYKNPADPSQTWTGRGKSPVWVQALKNAGTLDSALI